LVEDLVTAELGDPAGQLREADRVLAEETGRGERLESLRFADALSMKGDALRELDRREEALDCYETLIDRFARTDVGPPRSYRSPCRARALG
jgi:hypothetical protein